MVTTLYLSERVGSGLHGLRVVTLTWKTKSVLYVQKSLEALLDEDPCQTQEELALSLEVTQQNISWPQMASKPWE